MFKDLVTYLPDDILVRVDRATMRYSLEARVPFLDHRVIEHAWTLPMSYKIHEGRGKWIIREILRRYIPNQLVDRPKQGFSVPIGTWLRGPLREWGESLLTEQRLATDGFFSPDTVRNIWNEHQRGHVDAQHLLWSILMFQAWLLLNS
jgi:asparagine synthase (glutamine-hydrolysing)